MPAIKSASIWTHVLLLVLLLQFVAAYVPVWPRPASVHSGKSVRRLSDSFTITSNQQQDQDLNLAIGRAKSLVESLAIQAFIPDHGAGFADKSAQSEALTSLVVKISESKGQDGHSDASRRDLHSRLARDFAASQALVESSPEYMMKRSDGRPVAGGSISHEAIKPLGTFNESYSLIVGEKGAAMLEAETALGALRGLMTFVQLIHKAPNGKSKYIADVPLKIEDKPAFPYRGILLDSARNFLPVKTIKRQLDAMELLKMNQLHWHITDTHSWPLGLRSKDLGALAAKGAYGSDMIYSPNDVKELVAYAAQRGINIVLEIDMPGHQYMGVAEYPGELIVCGNEKNWSAFGAEPPTGHLDIRKEGATTLMKAIFTEIANYLPGKYMSTGNDEVEPQCYGLEKSNKAGMDKILAPFVHNIHSHLASLGKTPVVWEEAVLDFPQTGKELLKGTIVEAWTSSDNVAKILKSNADVHLVHVPTDYFYLGCGLGSWLGNYTGPSYCDFVPWQKQYAFDPYNGTQGIEHGKERVWGGQSALWGEQMDEANIESLLWPRAAAGGELFWTGAAYMDNGKETKRSAVEALPRLHEVRARLRKLDIYASPLQPLWCAFRPNECNLV